MMVVRREPVHGEAFTAQVLSVDAENATITPLSELAKAIVIIVHFGELSTE